MKQSKQDNKMISIRGISKARLLAEMYNHAQPIGMGYLQYEEGDMTFEEAQELIDNYNPPYANMKDKLYFDYVKGRCLKTDISGDEVDPWGYDRDLGEGALQAVVSKLHMEDLLHQTNMHQEKMLVAQNMIKYGGSFVSLLGKALQHADQTNAHRIKATFRAYWDEYLKMGE